MADEQQPGRQGGAALQGLLGYLNFSAGKPDPRAQRQLDDAYADLAGQGVARPWEVLHDRLCAELAALRDGGNAAFRDTAQAEAVLALVFTRLLPAYRAHHADLLAHLGDGDLFTPFFLARACEAVLAQGGPWDEHDRIVRGSLAQLNDFLGYRPIAVLENRPRGEPYDHERVRPIPLFLKGAGVACGRYHDLVAQALAILNVTDAGVLAEVQFDPQLLDELALDPRAYDHGHPVNRRPNYAFGEWDPHHIDNQGRYRRFVVRQVVLDGLLARIADCRLQIADLNDQSAICNLQSEMLYEAAAVLAGTVLMAAGISGSGPGAYDSSATLASLMPGIARCREGFYSGLLQRLPDPHGARLRQEGQATRQPFGGARQHLNHFLSRHRAAQLQQRHLAVIFAEMGYPDAGREEAARIPAASVRLLSEVLGRLASAHLHADRGELADAARLLPEAEALLHRGIACGAFADPWNILGFQGLFPLSPAREESVRDPRIEELVRLVEQILGGYARLLGEAAGTGDQALAGTLTRGMERLAEWWDQFASVEVADVPRVHGGEAVTSAKHVATALARWHQRGEAPADLAFWRQHLEGFRSPKAFASVVEALLRKQDYRAALGLLMSWLGQAEQVPLEDGEHAFHPLALHWMLAVTSGDGGKQEPLTPGPSPLSTGARGEDLPPSPPLRGRGVGGEGEPTWPLVQRFFDQLEANADEYWQVPTLGPELLHMPRAADEDDNPFAAAYEDVTFRDSADDEQEGSVADGGTLSAAFPLEAQGEEIGRRLRFLATLARLWALAARHDPRGHADAGKSATLATWLTTAREKQRQLLDLLDTLHACAVPEPSGSQESLMEYDRRRGLKEHLTYAAIGTCLDVALATGALHAAAGLAAPPEEDADRPAWEPWAMRLEQAFLHGDAAAARAALPHFLEAFCNEPLLFVPLAEGGQPRPVLRARFAQTVLRAMAAALPRLGLLRETHHLLATAWAMERAHPVGARGVTEFNYLFQGAFQAAVENVVASAEGWPAEQGGDEPLVTLLETVTRPFLGLWVEHSRGMQLSSVEGLRSEEDWQKLREFVRWYGRDLFHAGFMPLANLRGILHRGVGNYLDYLAENADPLHPVRLVNDLEGGLPREPVLRWLQFILQAVVENYEEFRDYNTTVARSDYGENLYLLLDFLRLKAGYERHAWQVRPLVLAHEVLAYLGRERAARLWEAALARSTRELADQHLEALTRLEQGHGMRLGTVADRLGERFVRPLALDRLCALIEPAVEEARDAGPQPAFERLREELRAYAATPTGVGLDVPPWLRQVGAEVQRVRAERTTLAELADDVLQMPERLLTFEEVRRQFVEEEKSDERGASGP